MFFNLLDNHRLLDLEVSKCPKGLGSRCWQGEKFERIPSEVCHGRNVAIVSTTTAFSVQSVQKKSEL